MELNQFSNFWGENFPNCPPVSYLFKHRLTNRWFRFHSLPESKRYAEDELETAQLLARQNEALIDIIGANSECVLVSGGYYDSPLVENLKQCPALSAFPFREFARLSKQDFDPDDLEPNEQPMYLTLFCANHKFERGSLDEVLLCVANEKIYNFFVVNCQRNHIFAPYDGGVDVFLKDSNERDKSKTKYKNWLSTHPSGF